MLIAAYVVVRVQVLARDMLREVVISIDGVKRVVSRAIRHGIHRYPVDAQGWSVDVDRKVGCRGVHDQKVAGCVDGKGVVGELGARVWKIGGHCLESELPFHRAASLATQEAGIPSDLYIVQMHTVHICWKKIPCWNGV